MKFKKIMFTASTIAVGSSLLGTVLTSCSKASVDSKLKIDLDEKGNLSKTTAFDYKAAIKDALSRSANWTQFKNAFADEIVYRWYLNRASSSKDDTSKNNSFWVNLDEWKTKIDKDWDETVKSCKNKYGKTYQFYLQNEHLAPAGGTVESYKHAKLVEKVRAEFISKVFANNYFGWKTADASSEAQKKYPNIYSKASTTIGEDALKNPSVWPNLGFYATTNTSFIPEGESVEYGFLAKNPDGDYATIQDYVFNRWFKTEKPFFSAAALFKYSNPKWVAEGKLSDIYDGVSTGVKIPDKPSEAFPFFGGQAPGEAKGTVAYVNWYNKLLKDGFETQYKDGSDLKSNGTISIPKTMTEDSQTLLLCYGSQMIGGSANSLYIPYANAAASLYLQMMDPTNTEYAPLNKATQTELAETIKIAIGTDGKKNPAQDNMAILSNFMFDTLPTKTATVEYNSYQDLTKIYETTKPFALFKQTTQFVKDNLANKQFVTNTVQYNGLGKTGAAATEQQPWVFELNEAGMHAQTIDGFQHVQKQNDLASRQNALKEVIKYRLMQKKCGHNDGIISCDLLGENGKLKTYFSDNFTNIILELAMGKDIDGAAIGENYQVFRKVESYKEAQAKDQFIELICSSSEQAFDFADLMVYFSQVINYEKNKKLFDAYETANTKTYAYRAKQIENARKDVTQKTVYENGLLAPIAYKNSGTKDPVYITSRVAAFGVADYTKLTKKDISEQIKAIAGLDFVTKSAAKAVDGSDGFSPQVASAKKAESNRFWYKSWIVDKMMYTYMGAKDGIVNGIKGTAMDTYMKKMYGDNFDYFANDEYIQNASAVTYYESKLFTSDRNYSNFGAKEDENYAILKNLKEAYLGNGTDIGEYDYKVNLNGKYCDEYLNRQTYLTTLAYLIGKDRNFENFYKLLNSKISEDEGAFVGYLSKTDKNIFGADNVNRATANLGSVEKDYKRPTYNPYYWTADVNNIFDSTGYSGKDAGTISNAKIASDQYWHVIQNKFGNTDIGLAGFTGLQTKSSNQLDSSSGLQAAAFDKIARTTDGSLLLSDKDKAMTDPRFVEDGRYVENYGCWFAYAGTKDSAGKQITFNPVTYKDAEGTEHTVSAADFVDGNNVSPALRLAKKISEQRLDDLRTLAKTLGNLFYGDSLFRKIGDGEKTYDTEAEMKYWMLMELPNKLNNAKNLACFQRMTNVELHEEGSTAIADKEHAFADDKGNAYKLIMTQVNKADVTEKHFAPTYKDGAWTANENACITMPEFFYILTTMAQEASVQQLAIADVVQTVYGDEKLIVYDAQLYNAFDSTWIKDWSKKTLG